MSSPDPTAPAPTFELPTTDHDDVIDAERAYNDAVRRGNGGGAGAGAAAAASGEGSPDELAFRLCWTLVHSSWQSDARRGKELAAALRQAPPSDPVRSRDLAYLEAVGEYKTGNLVAARRLLAGILDPSSPQSSSRQVEALKKEVDDQIVRDGLLGIGIAGGAAAALVFVAAAIFGASRR